MVRSLKIHLFSNDFSVLKCKYNYEVLFKLFVLRLLGKFMFISPRLPFKATVHYSPRKAAFHLLSLRKSPHLQAYSEINSRFSSENMLKILFITE